MYNYNYFQQSFYSVRNNEWIYEYISNYLATQRLARHSETGGEENVEEGASVLDHSLQDRYLQVMKLLQFGENRI